MVNWTFGNVHVNLSILGITIPRLPVGSTVWQGDISPMKFSYLTDRFIKRGKMDGRSPNPLSFTDIDHFNPAYLFFCLKRQRWFGVLLYHTCL